MNDGVRLCRSTEWSFRTNVRWHSTTSAWWTFPVCSRPDVQLAFRGLGAEVIKVEAPEGGDYSQYPPYGPTGWGVVP